MKPNKIFKSAVALTMAFLITVSCDGKLDEPLENQILVEDTDYTQTQNMSQLLTGAYQLLYNLQWETFPLLSVRGDDVNAAGDQVPLIETDEFRYDRSFWMYNSTWLNFYDDIIKFHAAMEEIERYKEFAANPAEADQYIAEIKVMRAWELLQLTRLWGDILIPTSSQTDALYNTDLSTREEVLTHISTQIDEALPLLPNVRPNQRTDVPGGITRHTALAVKAMAKIEMGDYQGAADATGEIISSNAFTLYSDYYELFKIPGKLADENLLELQYSDFGQSSGENINYLNAFFGPNNWTPAVAGSSPGWGFWEPSMKYIKFMLDRGEEDRLVTSVLFTKEGIEMIEAEPGYDNLPAYISNTTRDGDIIGRTDDQPNPRAKFSSGKHYLPSNQLIPGRTSYGSNKNFIVIRYSEVLLMHAEALVNGATSSAMSADAAINEVRSRAGLGNISGATLDTVLDEKFAEFGMEWGIRFYDLVRYDRTAELNYGGRTYGSDDRFLPYPLEQIDILPQLDVN
ncbi:putative outer membrane starch-binding protein [Roseivirga pacifica]|uniref:Starch-binding associating with outer membrane n=1 Tax=Roseivirga pacifica TaxID=1267423 RepID=A0A1I0PY98_9BACT|nr:RagB/SusD family nutrient uptake outer membrane protein [Roseivirga pacifica]MCO6360353.1 RagB/SusD family nutrient uptake outer membrane protein [Roseivirga pacifica]MCO6368242.1 RagB/SusD family nutrient uptake outer membrane protein [Roseivirga pacifica]MCO6372384.1 RagB/SusD family nutrient uptake outer membrane protein [Roseivirga pacifica]MCO6376442.1 RagB/SusD family nutrient uptake outer membrane protein [Roseivirga pacifica]MCO6378278.1 RagB/SusD family nutrient uptake outer membra